MSLIGRCCHCTENCIGCSGFPSSITADMGVWSWPHSASFSHTQVGVLALVIAGRFNPPLFDKSTHEVDVDVDFIGTDISLMSGEKTLINVDDTEPAFLFVSSNEPCAWAWWDQTSTVVSTRQRHHIYVAEHIIEGSYHIENMTGTTYLSDGHSLPVIPLDRRNGRNGWDFPPATIRTGVAAQLTVEPMQNNSGKWSFAGDVKHWVLHCSVGVGWAWHSDTINTVKSNLPYSVGAVRGGVGRAAATGGRVSPELGGPTGFIISGGEAAIDPTKTSGSNPPYPGRVIPEPRTNAGIPGFGSAQSQPDVLVYAAPVVCNETSVRLLETDIHAASKLEWSINAPTFIDLSVGWG